MQQVGIWRFTQRQFVRLGYSTNQVKNFLTVRLTAAPPKIQSGDKHLKKVPALFPYLVQETGEEGVGHVVVEKCPLVHQDTFDVLAEGRILTQQLHTRFSQNRLKEQRQ